ncbi:MAG: EthD family reductase [Verrucomicrobia bacterium]|nr:EthD family reductase [Verrucomicrobiota bacterium]
MIKRIILVTRRPDLSGDEFRRYYTEKHAPIVAKLPGLRHYTQNPTLPGPDGQEQEISGMAEVWYDDEAAFRAAMQSPEAAAANESLTYFVDVSKTRILVVEEHVIL